MSTEVDALGEWTPEENKDTERELWNLDITLTELILPRLKAFKEMDRMGYPVIEGIDPQDEKKTTETWEGILDDMIKGFEAHLQLAKDSTYDGDEDFDYVSQREEQLDKVIDKGLLLFAKHYKSLWD